MVTLHVPTPSVTDEESFSDGEYKYKDYSQITEDSPEILRLELEMEQQRTRRGQEELFPAKLHYLLEQLEKEGDDDIVKWNSHGRSFKICDVKAFTKRVLTRYVRDRRVIVALSQ